jgi:GAF domain-containing protein
MNELIQPGRLDLAGAVRALAGIVLGSQPFDEVLKSLTEVTKQTVDGAFEVSVTIEGRDPRTVASTAAFADGVDEAQYDAGYGPCLDALRFGETVVVENQRTETRWPQYSPRAAAAGVGSSVSVPLLVDDTHIAALNIYGAEPHAFGVVSVRAAEDLAVYAAVVVNNAGLYFEATTKVEQLAEAMTSRAVIEQAKGVLMGARRCSSDEAFGILVRLSQQSNRKLRDVAQGIVDQISTGSPSDA